MLEICRELKIKINTQKGIYASRWSFTKYHCMMDDQQNVKFRNALFTLTTLLIGTFSSIPITAYN